MIDIEQVCAILVTRGDIDLQPIIDSLPYTELIVWDNSKREDLKSSGLYEAIAETERPVIYFQDDDCLVNGADHARLLESYEPGVVSALMPPTRTDYFDTVLCGWGSLWDRDLPSRAWNRYARLFDFSLEDPEWLEIGADFVWPILTPFTRLDAEHQDFAYASHAGRTSTTGGYEEIKATYMNRARLVRDHKSLTVIVPTLGRETLAATLASIDIDCEVIVVADEAGGDLARALGLAVAHGAKCFSTVAPDHEHSYGNAQRNYGMTQATGSHLVFMDDDDAYAPGGLQLMLDAACEVPVIFRMVYPDGDVLWKEPELHYCNVGSPMFVVPNRLLGEWHAHDGVARGGDFQFISECVARQGEPLWREEIVALIRPA